MPGSVATAPASRLSGDEKTALVDLRHSGAIYLGPCRRIGFPLDANRNESWHGWYIDAITKVCRFTLARMRCASTTTRPLVLSHGGSREANGRRYPRGTVALARLAVRHYSSSGHFVRALGGSRTGAAFGAFWLFAILTQFFQYYVGVNDPSLLAIALMALGLAYFLNCLQAGRAVEPAIALMVVAGFFKHNFPMIPAVALIWLAFIDKKAALRAAIFGALLCIIGVSLCVMAFGPNFLKEMTMPRVITFNHVFSAANRLQWIAPAVAAWGLWAWPNRRQPAAQFTALLIVMTLFNGLYTAAGAGVTYNAYLAVTFATAIAIGVAIEKSTPQKYGGV